MSQWKIVIDPEYVAESGRKMARMIMRKEGSKRSVTLYNWQGEAFLANKDAVEKFFREFPVETDLRDLSKDELIALLREKEATAHTNGNGNGVHMASRVPSATR